QPQPRARDSERRKKKSRRAPKKRPPTPVPSSGATPASDGASFDVELVPMTGSGGAPPKARLSRRDFIMFFSGVGSVTAAYLLGRGLAALLRRSRDRNNENDEEKD